MRQVSELPERRPGGTTTHYTSNMHGERTHVEVYTRVPDYSFRTFEMGRMGLIAMRCGAMSIRREAADIRARPNPMSTFILQVEGRSAFSHYGNQIELEEGDFTLCNNSTQYDLRLEGPSELIMFRVPTPMVYNHIPSPDILCGRRLARDESLASTAAAMARDLAAKDPSRLQAETGERAGRHLLDVLASSYMSLFDDRNSASAVMSLRFWKVKVFIEEHLRDPELSPSFIARHLRLSDRYLRMIFAVSDACPSAYILGRRLDECAAQLRDPRWRHCSITNIAFSWGFNSGAHFSRRFRERFACSPRDYRNRNLP
ncbi:MAG: helix-turn-helix domain-containing protein [Sphingomonas sp.]